MPSDDLLQPQFEETFAQAIDLLLDTLDKARAHNNPAEITAIEMALVRQYTFKFWIERLIDYNHDKFFIDDQVKSIFDIPGLTYRSVEGDGSCFYHAVRKYLNNEESNIIRKNVVDYIKAHKDEFELDISLTEEMRTEKSVQDEQEVIKHRTIEQYLEDSYNYEEFVEQIHINALMKMEQRAVLIIYRTGQVINLSELEKYPDNTPIFVFYNNRDHYEALDLDENSSPEQIAVIVDTLKKMNDDFCMKRPFRQEQNPVVTWQILRKATSLVTENRSAFDDSFSKVMVDKDKEIEQAYRSAWLQFADRIIGLAIAAMVVGFRAEKTKTDQADSAVSESAQAGNVISTAATCGAAALGLVSIMVLFTKYWFIDKKFINSKYENIVHALEKTWISHTKDLFDNFANSFGPFDNLNVYKDSIESNCRLMAEIIVSLKNIKELLYAEYIDAPEERLRTICRENDDFSKSKYLDIFFMLFDKIKNIKLNNEKDVNVFIRIVYLAFSGNQQTSDDSKSSTSTTQSNKEYKFALNELNTNLVGLCNLIDAIKKRVIKIIEERNIQDEALSSTNLSLRARYLSPIINSTQAFFNHPQTANSPNILPLRHRKVVSQVKTESSQTVKSAK